MPFEKPIIVFGTGRSGTTVFHRILSMHGGISFLSTLCNRHPEKPELNRRLLELFRYPVIGPFAERHWIPSEAYHFWEHYCKGFMQPCRDLRADDLSVRARRQIESALMRCVASDRPRLLIKVTGWPRLGFMSSLFPEARFVHVIRDGRAVANSLLDVNWWWGWRGPTNWRWGPLSNEDQAEWDAADKSFIVLAAIQWKMHMKAAEATEDLVPADNLLKVRYEALCEDPKRVMRDVLRFAELEWTPAFEKRLAGFRLSSANDKWKSSLNEIQQRALQGSLGNMLHQYGYE